MILVGGCWPNCAVSKAAQEPTEPYILVMDEVGPSDVARLDPARVAGILTARGGATAHSAIVARALGIPAPWSALALPCCCSTSGTPLLLDGQRGRLHVDADAATLQRATVERDSPRTALASRLGPASRAGCHP